VGSHTADDLLTWNGGVLPFGKARAWCLRSDCGEVRGQGMARQSTARHGTTWQVYVKPSACLNSLPLLLQLPTPSLILGVKTMYASR
jgi:hypothetical protein